MSPFMHHTPARCSGCPANLMHARHTKPLTTVTINIPIHIYSAITHCVWTDVGSPLSSGSSELLKSVAPLQKALILPLSLHLLSVSLSCSYSAALFLSPFSLCVSHPPRSCSYTPVPSPPPLTQTLRAVHLICLIGL